MSLLSAGISNSSFSDLSKLIRSWDKLVFKNITPGWHFLSHNSGKQRQTASSTDTCLEQINKPMACFIASDAEFSDFERYAVI